MEPHMRNDHSGVNPWKAVKVLAAAMLIFVFAYATMQLVNCSKSANVTAQPIIRDRMSQLLYETDALVGQILENKKFTLKDRELILHRQKEFVRDLSVICSHNTVNDYIEKCMIRELSVNLQTLRLDERLLKNK